MAAKFVFTVVALCALVQASLGDAPAPTDMQLPSLEEVKTKTEEALANVQTGFHKLVGVENNEQLTKKISDGTETLKNSLNDFISKLSEEAKTHGITDAFNSFTETITNKIRELEEAHPDVKKQADEVKVKFQDTLQTVVTQADKLSKDLSSSTAGVNEQFSKLTKEVLEQAQAVANDVRSSVDKFAKEHEATHAHTK